MIGSKLLSSPLQPSKEEINMHSTILLTIVVSTSIQGELGILKEIIKQITIQLSIKIEMAYNKANPRKKKEEE